MRTKGPRKHLPVFVSQTCKGSRIPSFEEFLILLPFFSGNCARYLHVSFNPICIPLRTGAQYPHLEDMGLRLMEVKSHKVPHPRKSEALNSFLPDSSLNAHKRVYVVGKGCQSCVPFMTSPVTIKRQVSSGSAGRQRHPPIIHYSPGQSFHYGVVNLHFPSNILCTRFKKSDQHK